MHKLCIYVYTYMYTCTNTKILPLKCIYYDSNPDFYHSES